jgi:adenylylsulfate kinase
MIILMAGLPGTGKTTLARELAARTDGAVLNKDEIRAALFAPSDIEYSTEQDDFCMQVMLGAAGQLLRKNSARAVLLDGRPFSRRYQIEQVIGVADEQRQPWRILHCVCSEESARERLSQGEHVAGNRDFELYLKVKKSFEEIERTHTVIDTDRPVEECVELSLQALR